MKLLEKVTELEATTESSVIFKTIVREEWPFEEALKRTDEMERKIKEQQAQVAEGERIIRENVVQKDVEEINSALEKNIALKDIFQSSLKPYVDDLDVQGRTFIHNEKLKAHYDRLDGDTKTTTAVRILNDCRVKLGINDIAHPIIQRLRVDIDTI